jgi:hypothetical protein
MQQVNDRSASRSSPASSAGICSSGGNSTEGGRAHLRICSATAVRARGEPILVAKRGQRPVDAEENILHHIIDLAG